ncbi:IPT/TIG domain-containing protein [Leifsonia xyli]|nr:IPT/TIG domain-containing protein [Leifsonia xyli]
MSVSPANGPQTGGTDVTLTGTGFTGATGVTFGGAPAAEMTVMDDSTITATTPAHLPATVSIAVEHPNGDSSPDGFTFDAVPGAPVISGLAPGHGPAIGGTTMTLSGSGFIGTTDVTVDGVSVPFSVIDDGTITVTAPPHAAGTVPVVVTTPIGPTPSAVFTYDLGTTVNGMTPSSGPETGGTAVTITGGCFTDATGVLFGTTPAASFRVMTDATIAAVSPAGTGTADITVVGAAVCGTGTLTGAFRYLDPGAPIIVPAGGTTSTGVAAGSAAGRLAGTGSTTDGFALPAGIGLLMLACGGLVILRRTRRA